MASAVPTIPNGLFTEEAYQLNDIGSERGLLACVMNQPSLIFDCERMLPPEALSLDLHQYIYKIMLYMAQMSNTQGWPLAFDGMSMLSVAKYLGPQFEQSFIAKTDGMEQIRGIELLKPMVMAEQFPQYLHVLLDRHKRRLAYHTARQIMQATLDFQTNPDATALTVKAEVAYGAMAFDSKGQGGERTLRKLGSYGPEAMIKTRLQHDYPHLGLFHVPSRTMPWWMQLMGGGFPRKGLIMVCARPKVGKSTLLLSTAIDMAVGQMWQDAGGQWVQSQQMPVLYLDTEMSGEEMFFRQLSNTSNVLESNILAGKFYEDEVSTRAIEQQLIRLGDAPLYYVNIAGQSPEFVRSIMRQFRNQHVGTRQVQDKATGKWHTFSNPAAVFYDWMRLPDGDGLKHAQETQLLGFLASSIKQAAYELDLPVIAGAQLNREAVGATSADWEWNAEGFISGSDRLAMYCSQLCVLRNLLPDEIETMPDPWQTFRPGKVDLQQFKWNQRLHMVLNRSGSEARYGIPLYIDKGYARYEEVTDKETMDHIMSRASKKPPAKQQFGGKGALPTVSGDQAKAVAVNSQQQKAG